MNNFKKVFILFIFLTFIPVGIAFAQGGTDSGTSAGGTDNTSGETVTKNEGATPVKLINPLGSTKKLPDLVESLLKIVLSIGVPVIALAIIYAGFQFVAAQGNPTKLQEARRTLLYVLIGAAILLAAYVIAEAIDGTIREIRK